MTLTYKQSKIAITLITAGIHLMFTVIFAFLFASVGAFGFAIYKLLTFLI
jgi:hypothetical protein